MEGLRWRDGVFVFQCLVYSVLFVRFVTFFGVFWCFGWYQCGWWVFWNLVWVMVTLSGISFKREGKRPLMLHDLLVATGVTLCCNIFATGWVRVWVCCVVGWVVLP